MRAPCLRMAALIGLLFLALARTQSLHAQQPLPTGVQSAAQGTVGQNMLQLDYATKGPLSNVSNMVDYGLLFTPNRDFAVSATLLFGTDLPLIPGLSFELGPKVYAAVLAGSSNVENSNKNDVFALALGGGVRFDIWPSMGLAAFGNAYYAPNVLIFGEASGVYDLAAGGEIRLLSQMVAIVGYRWFRFTLQGQPSERVANEVFGGLRWQFK